MLIFLSGENTYQIRQTEERIIAEFLAKNSQHGIEKIDGELFDSRDFSGLLQGASLFAAAKLVIVKNLSLNKTAWEALTDWIDKIPDETTLLLIEPNPDKRTKTYKTLKSKADFKEFKTPDGVQLTSWLQDFAKSIGGELGKIEAQSLVNRVGTDQWRLSTEIEKVVNYDPKVTLKNIELLVDATPEGNAFELLDASLAGDRLRVETIIGQLKIQEDPYKFFGLLASQIHSLAIVATAQGKSADQIAKDAGVHPFVVRKSQGLSKKLGLEKVKKIAQIVAACDKQLKSTGADPWDLLGVCLQKISSI